MPILTQNPIAVNELVTSHILLDRCGVPRRLKGVTLTLPERIAFLHGRLVTARNAARVMAVMPKQIFILSKAESEALIPKEYRILEAKA